MSREDKLSTYDYALPEGLIAKEPLPERDASRLMVLDRRAGTIAHRIVRDLPQLLHPNDCLVLNNSRVLPARLFGVRKATGGKWEGLFLNSTTEGRWRLIGQTRGFLRLQETITLTTTAGDRLELTLIEKEADGVCQFEPSLVELGCERSLKAPFKHGAVAPSEPLVAALVELDCERSLKIPFVRGAVAPIEPPVAALNQSVVDLLNKFGTVPLPPYMGRKQATATDWERYQTTYSRYPGSVAAPTAGLHFTPELLDACRRHGISIAEVTLHVGMGTFRPVAVEILSEHRMHSEWCELSVATAEALTKTRSIGGRIVAVGTTSLRTLESAAGRDDPGTTSQFNAWQGETNLFIRPPHRFHSTDVLLTNFHLPKSTLLMLVAAFGGLEFVLDAYRIAIAERYRFFSYGDAMLIV